MESLADRGRLTRKQALQIITDLKKGTPPPVDLIHLLHVGRERWLTGMLWYLEAVRDDGLSAVRLIVGDYGSGKTHFLRMTAHAACQLGFVISEVTLDKSTRLDQFETVWRKLLQKLTVGDAETTQAGIDAILGNWCERVLSSERLAEALEELDNLSGLDPDFRLAMRGYLHEWMTDGPGATGRTLYLQWLYGGGIRPPGVRSRIDRASARPMLRSLILFLRRIGYSGLVLFLDELELLLTQNQRVRDASYEVLRQFIDDTEGMANFLVVCSLTEQVMHDHARGIPSYPALYQRIGGMLTAFSPRDYRSVTVNLNRLPLTTEELFELAKRIRFVHAVAYDWDAEARVSDEFLRRFADRASHMQEVAAPRYLVQLTVDFLEAVQQNPDEPLEELVPSDLEVVERLRGSERERYVAWSG